MDQMSTMTIYALCIGYVTVPNVRRDKRLVKNTKLVYAKNVESR
jgi:hypothetical protein